MSGPRPTPPALRVLSGNPGKRGVSREIREHVKAQLTMGGARSTVGPPPDGLTEYEQSIWQRVADNAFWLDEQNRECLEAYCKAAQLLRDDPNRLRVAAITLRSLAAELGLSATARAKVGMVGKKQSAADLPHELTDAAAKPTGA